MKGEDIMSLIKREEIQAKVNKKGILMKTLVDHKDATVRNLLLKPNQSIPPHQVPVHVLFYVIEGQGTINIGEQSYAVKNQDMVTCSPNTPMSVQASSTGLSFLNIKTPSLK
jgi:quercetin dioxygenase-like cupin family protein